MAREDCGVGTRVPVERKTRERAVPVSSAVTSQGPALDRTLIPCFSKFRMESLAGAGGVHTVGQKRLRMELWRVDPKWFTGAEKTTEPVGPGRPRRAGPWCTRGDLGWGKGHIVWDVGTRASEHSTVTSRCQSRWPKTRRPHPTPQGTRKGQGCHL